MAKIKIGKEKKSIEELEKKVQELEESWKRALADYTNLEKRISEQKANFIRLANLGIIDKLLSVLDDLDRALEHIKDNGLKIVREQFWEVLTSEGVKEIEVLNKDFNPETMDCVEMVPGTKNKVMKIQLKGYTLNNHVIRPAKVEVGMGKK